MRNEKRIETTRLVLGIFSAVFGILGFVFETRILFGVALFCAAGWLFCLLILADMNNRRIIEEERNR